LKDRLYTAGEDSAARRSAQNALYHITHSLVRLIAPILSFTAEEAWEVLGGRDDCSIFVEEWYGLPDAQLDGEAIAAWLKIGAWRAKVNKQLEEARTVGLIGSALAAEVDVYVAGEDYEVLARLGVDLRFVSSPRGPRCIALRPKPKQHIDVSASLHDKCERCWHYREDVGSDVNHQTLCGRCVSNLFGSGEARKYA